MKLTDYKRLMQQQLLIKLNEFISLKEIRKRFEKNFRLPHFLSLFNVNLISGQFFSYRILIIKFKIFKFYYNSFISIISQ